MLDFLVRWFTGPLGYSLVMREVGWCVGPLKSSRFFRGSFSVEGLSLWFSENGRFLDRMNVFMGVGFWVDPSYLEPEKGVMLYDRLAFDLDSEGDPEAAVKAALDFSSVIKDRYGATPIVFRSGFKGAHVVVPLYKPTDWEGYQLLWWHFLGLLPKEYRVFVDKNMLEWNRLDRVPLTWNVREGGKALARIIYPEEFSRETFDWDKLRGLDPSQVTVYKVVLPEPPKPRRAPRKDSEDTDTAVFRPGDPVMLKDLEAVPPCVKSWINELVSTGELDHYARLNLVLFMKWVGYGVEDCVNLLRRYARDFREGVTRYYVEHAFGLRGSRKDYSMYSCTKLKELGLCQGCGWGRNPVTYYKTRIKESLRQGVSEAVGPNSLPPEIKSFLNEFRGPDFGYEDFRTWLQGRKRLTAPEWHYWERTLRKLAEEGVLGRKFLVGGEWVDYGPGPVERPPSKEVRFYLAGR